MGETSEYLYASNLRLLYRCKPAYYLGIVFNSNPQVLFRKTCSYYGGKYLSLTLDFIYVDHR